MARKPNYRFARLERERTKAARKAARAKMKAERAELRRLEKDGLPVDGEVAADETAGETADETADETAEESPDTDPEAAGDGLHAGEETTPPE